MCESVGIEFLPLRVWISIWIVVIGVVVIAFDGSAFVKYFTRFTQEIFSALISLLYIYEAVYKLYLVCDLIFIIFKFNFNPLIHEFSNSILTNRDRHTLNSCTAKILGLTELL